MSIASNMIHPTYPKLSKIALICAWVAFGLLAASWGYGLTLLIRTKGSLVQHVREFQGHPIDTHNLASFRYGPTLSASSYLNDFGQQHHPLFLVDEVAKPSIAEKWASAPRDRSPWVEIRWHEPATLERVRLLHPGPIEGKDTNAKMFTIRCIQSNSRRGKNSNQLQSNVSITVYNNAQDDVTENRLHCQNSIGIRIEMKPNRSTDVVRLFEVEAWGQ
jgi:hypothetical protein